MSFTSWQDEKKRLEDALASMDLTTQSYNADGDVVTFRNLAELRKHYDWVCLMASRQSGSVVGRTVAGNGGGRW